MTTKAIDDLTCEEIAAELKQLEGVKSQRARDLETEYRRELIAREARERNGQCNYCGRRLGSEPECKHPERHARKSG